MPDRRMDAYATALHFQHEEESAAIGVGYADAEVIRARAAARAGEADAENRLAAALIDRKSARAHLQQTIIARDEANAAYEAIEHELDEKRAKRHAAKTRRAAFAA